MGMDDRPYGGENLGKLGIGDPTFQRNLVPTKGKIATTIQQQQLRDQRVQNCNPLLWFM